jgi:hypothetical protein
VETAQLAVPTAGAGNVISGNRSHGVLMTGDSSQQSALWNLIGTDISGAKSIWQCRQRRFAIEAAARQNRVGGNAAARAIPSPTTALNGILVTGSPTANGNAFRRNAIYSNGLLVSISAVME